MMGFRLRPSDLVSADPFRLLGGPTIARSRAGERAFHIGRRRLHCVVMRTRSRRLRAHDQVDLAVEHLEERQYLVDRLAVICLIKLAPLPQRLAFRNASSSFDD